MHIYIDIQTNHLDMERVWIRRNTTRRASYTFAYTLITLFNASTVGYNTCTLEQWLNCLCSANPLFINRQNNTITLLEELTFSTIDKTNHYQKQHTPLKPLQECHCLWVQYICKNLITKHDVTHTHEILLYLWKSFPDTKLNIQIIEVLYTYSYIHTHTTDPTNQIALMEGRLHTKSTDSFLVWHGRSRSRLDPTLDLDLPCHTTNCTIHCQY